ncbi:MAG TPA: cupin domain-containing protein [Thermoanaerobaculia bacterium]|nr:cupin domain-containing protein [Thermoanaerobaculia bacterium]
MFTPWLAGASHERFEAEHFQKAPYSEPGSALAAMPLMTWDKVAALLAVSPRPDVIVAKQGRFLEHAEPDSIEAAQALFAAGCSIVLRALEHFDGELRELAETFGAGMEGEVTVHSFATPRGAIGFGWHYDCEDVFIAQTAGTKEYYLRENTVNPRPTRDAMPRDMEYGREVSPLIRCTLVAGDWLYVPRGWWHMGRGLDDALSLSVGVLSPAAAGTAESAPGVS